MMYLPIIVSLLLSSLVQVTAIPCTFCTRGMITEDEKPIHIPGYEFINSCGSIDSLLPAFLTEDDPQCQQLQSISTLCGCPPPDDSCSFCPDGSAITYPDKEVPWLVAAFGGIVPTCELVEAYSASLISEDETCSLLQAISSYCGCRPLDNACSYCNGEPLQKEFYDVVIPVLSNEALGIIGTCELYWETQYQLLESDIFCELSGYIDIHCGCNGGHLPYYGTSTEGEQKMLAWLPRGIGTISLIASCLVLLHILKSPKKRAGVYQQFIILIAVFDIVTSLVWVVGPAAVKKVNKLSGLPWGIYGAQGTTATCTASGFFFQLGTYLLSCPLVLNIQVFVLRRSHQMLHRIGGTSVFLTLSLTIFYYLVIVRGVKEPRLRELRPWLFIPPLLVGFGLACASIPFINSAWSTCQPRLTPIEKNPLTSTFLLFLPMSLSTASILILLLVIYCKVRNQMRQGRKWAISTRRRQSITQSLGGTSSRLSSLRSNRAKRPSAQERLQCKVFYQCISYAMAYGVTWPILLLAQSQGENFDYPLWVWTIVVAVAPMQGFNNSICYFRPYIGRSIARRRKNRFSNTQSRDQNAVAAEAPIVKGTREKLFRSIFSSRKSSVDDVKEVNPTVELANWDLDVLKERELGEEAAKIVSEAASCDVSRPGIVDSAHNDDNNSTTNTGTMNMDVVVSNFSGSCGSSKF